MAENTARAQGLGQEPSFKICKNSRVPGGSSDRR